MRFANIYRRWWGNESRFRNLASTTSSSELLDEWGVPTPGVDTAAVDRTFALTVLSTIKNPRAQRAVLLTAQGRSQAEIAEVLGCTEKAVERLLAKQRQQVRDRRAG